MTICREPGGGVGGSARRLALLLRVIGGSAARLIRRHVPPTRDVRRLRGLPGGEVVRGVRSVVRPRAAADGVTAEDVSFELHVSQALSIACQVPAMRVAPAGPARGAVRSLRT